MARVWHRLGPLVLLLVSASVLAGCLGSDPAPQPAEGSDEGGEDSLAMITLTVLDPGQVPFEGATVNLTTKQGEQSQVTNVLGIARFEELSPGNVSLQIDARDFKQEWVNFTLSEGQHAQTEVILVRAEPALFVELLTFEGFFECSATYLIITGSCLAPVHYVSNLTGIPVPVNPTNEKFIFDFEVRSGWTKIMVTQEWPEPDFALGSMMRVNLEPHDPDQVEHNDRYARAEGESPISLEIEVGELHPTASEEDIVLDEQGGWVQTRSFHLGIADTHNPGGSEFLGVGIAYQQRFTVHVEIHYTTNPI